MKYFQAVFLAVIIFVMAIPSSGLCEGYGRVGSIVAYTGTVKVLQDGLWVNVNKFPFSLAAGMRIIVRQGTAQVRFDGGAQMKLNRFTMVDLANNLGDFYRKGGATEPEGEGGNKYTTRAERRKVSILTGEVWLSVPETANSKITYRLLTPTATAWVRQNSMIARVGLDGESFITHLDEIIVSGRYSPHPTGEFKNTQRDNLLASQTVFNALELIGRPRPIEELPVRDASSVAFQVISTAWPSLEDVSSLKSEMAEKQMASERDRAAEAVNYLDDIIKTTRPYRIPPDGLTLMHWPRTISSDRGIGRAFGMEGFLDPPVSPRGEVDFRVHAGLDIEGRQDDNIFNLPSKEIDDNVYVYSPRVLLGLYSERVRAEAAYELQVYRYAEYEEEDYTSAAGQAGIRLGLLHGTYLALGARLTSTMDIRSEDRHMKEKHHYDTLSAELGYNPTEQGRFGAMLRYEGSGLEYNDRDLKAMDRDIQEGSLTFSYKYLPRTFFVLEALGTVNEYPESDDLKTNADSSDMGGALGIVWSDEARLSGHLKAGARKRDYENEKDPAGNMYLDESYAHLDMDMAYRVGQGSSIDVSAYSRMSETLYQGDGADISNSTHYFDRGGDLMIRGRLWGWFGFNLGGGMSTHTYAANETLMKTREDDVVRGLAELIVFFGRNIKASLGYEYMKIDSNDNNLDEEHNIGVLTIAAEI